MRCALYLRPAGLSAWPHFDDAVKGWLRIQGYEPVDGGSFETVVCLPYDGGGTEYGRDVSIAMANRILEHLAVDGEIRWIRLHETKVDNSSDTLKEVELRFEGHGIVASRPTLAILSEGEAAEVDVRIREHRWFAGEDLGKRWQS